MVDCCTETGTEENETDENLDDSDTSGEAVQVQMGKRGLIYPSDVLCEIRGGQIATATGTTAKTAIP